MDLKCSGPCIILLSYFLKDPTWNVIFWSYHKFYIFFFDLYFMTHLCILCIPHCALTTFLVLFSSFNREGSWGGRVFRCVSTSKSQGIPPILMLQLFLVSLISYALIPHCLCMPCLCHVQMMGNDGSSQNNKKWNIFDFLLIPAFKDFLRVFCASLLRLNHLTINDY